MVAGQRGRAGSLDRRLIERWPCRVHGSAAAQMKEAGAQAAADTGPDLLETWLILEYCDQGSFDHAIRSGKFTKDLVQPSKLISV